MADSDLIMTLGKVIIAAAWADGEISNDEVNCLKDLIYRLPDVTARQWEELAIYMDSPIGEAERGRLVAQLSALTRSADQRNLALATLDNMTASDGGVSPAEQQVVAEVRAALETGDTGAWSSFSRMLIGKREKAVVAAGPNREAYLDDYINNRVYYRIRQQLAESGTALSLSDAELRRLGLAGGLMAVVAEVSPEITDGEKQAIAEALRGNFGLSAEQATYVTEVAISPGVSDQDFFRLVREFSEEFTLEERQGFLATLFAVAAADGQASFEEIEQLRVVAQGMKLTHQEFIDAKLTLPREKRAD